MTEGSITTTNGAGVRLRVATNPDGTVDVELRGFDPTDGDVAACSIDALTAAQVGDLLASRALQLGRPLPQGVLQQALERRMTGPEPPYAPDLFGTRPGDTRAVDSHEPVPLDLDLGDGELDALRSLLELLDVEWGSTGTAQVGSERWVLRRAVERHLTQRSDERRLPVLGGDAVSALVRLVDACSQPWVDRVIREQALTSTVEILRTALNVALIEQPHTQVMWAVRRVDGQPIGDEWAFATTSGPLDWSPVIDDMLTSTPGEAVEYEMVRMVVTPWSKRSTGDDAAKLTDAALIAAGQGTLDLATAQHVRTDVELLRRALTGEYDALVELGVGTVAYAMHTSTESQRVRARGTAILARHPHLLEQVTHLCAVLLGASAVADAPLPVDSEGRVIEGCPMRCNDGMIERDATPEEVDAGCELGVAFDPCPVCNALPQPGEPTVNLLDRD